MANGQSSYVTKYPESKKGGHKLISVKSALPYGSTIFHILYRATYCVILISERKACKASSI